MSQGLQNYDIAIIGGGATGCAMALGLQRHTRLNVVLIDAGEPPNPHSEQAGFDQRTIALSDQSLRILQALGCSLNKMVSAPIEHIHVSDKGHAGQVLLHANDYGIEAFGLVVSLAQLGQQLYQSLDLTADRLTYLNRTEVTEIVRTQEHCQFTLSSGKTLTSKLLIMADGGRSTLAEQLGFRRTHNHYEQTAITLSLETSEPHRGWAYERFTDSGPLALLPLESHRFGVVWTVLSDEAEYWLTQSDKQVINHLQAQFGYRCGMIKRISERASYPLALRQLDSVFQHRCVAIGNAAQTLHPIAGQGVNLGFRDVSDLLSVVKEHAQDAGLYSVLRAYQQKRHVDKTRTVFMTDALVRLFSNQHLPLVMGRNIGLTGLNFLPNAKKAFAHNAMGKSHAAL
ncbi:2-octaprenyl-6-methoxyphenyl hydroxylase [Alteromonas sediminis]|uniref:2-octaprenyl-6-methoxyphenyl hydroxylase n=1 Tax=Alteromonas sediminis TaxID=2259342 RepID=A0A3N5Y4W4_9ALTE|nr:2-octaprenyl-6-methoxyphenyl hydroxylase [Alteromonas sediminis]RPJ67986.1 2-octaprenyl-6-methoxyphenyl hydroxylase [Alteromonas sediminis]